MVIMLALAANAKTSKTMGEIYPEKPGTETVQAEPYGFGKWLIKAIGTLIGGGSGGGVDVQSGHNTLENGVVYPCIGGGICYVKTGSATQTTNTTTSSLKAGQNALLKDANGTYALVITKEEAKDNKDFNLTEGYYMIPVAFSFSTVTTLPKDFQALTVKANVKYDLEELDNHYAIILNK